MRLVAAGLAALAVTAGVAGAGSQADPVTLAMRQYTNPASKLRVWVWYGQVATSAAGEDVEVLGRECRSKDFRLFAGTKTTPGGGYEVENALPQPPYQIVDVNSGTTFRARWRDQLSNTILHKIPIGFYPVKIPKRRAWKVVVNPAPLYMKLGGKPVILQRFRSGKWERYKSAPLALKANYDYGGATNFEAVFDTPTRGMRLRAIVPTKTVAPCYFGKTSPAWRT